MVKTDTKQVRRVSSASAVSLTIEAPVVLLVGAIRSNIRGPRDCVDPDRENPFYLFSIN